MFTLSGKLIWIPLYLFLVYLLFRKFKIKGIFYLVLIGITILLADQTTSGFMKPFFERLRPSHAPEIKDLVHIVNDYRGGKYGFASSHAANTFAIAMFFNLIMNKGIYRALFFWAVLVSYTRIYLGVHYPGDIIVGAFVGIASSWITLNFGEYLFKRFNDKGIKI